LSPIGPAAQLNSLLAASFLDLASWGQLSYHPPRNDFAHASRLDSSDQLIAFRSHGWSEPFRSNLFWFEHFAGVVREDELVNSLKPLLTVAVLAGIGYGVYVRINSGADAPPPAGVAAGWDATPKVQLPDSGSPGTNAPWGGAGSSVAPPFVGPLGGRVPRCHSHGRHAAAVAARERVEARA